jgi:uncharacterized lipoprotein YmbA
MTTRAALLALSFVLAACSPLAPQRDPSRFYKLTPLAAADVDGSGGRTGIVLGVGPVSLPGYLHRPQLATRVGANQVRFSDVARWSEPLELDMTRVLARDLSLLLQPDRLLTFPWFGADAPTIVVMVDVEQFEQLDDGTTRLVAAWTLRDGKHGKQLVTRETTFTEHPPGGDDATVAALSGMLNHLSRDIAAAVRQTPRP